MQDEQSLVREAQQGNAGAFAKIYETYFDRVFRYVVVRVGNAAEAEDITQDVFLRALDSVRAFQWRGVPFSAWLFRIAHNLLTDRLRSKGRHEEVALDDDMPLVDGRQNPSDLVELKISVEQMLASMQHLTESQRQVLALRFGSGLSIEETAQSMSKKEGAIKALQHSAVQALRRHMTRAPTAIRKEP
ncbi:MAG: sigma-70 family RNA polymerase sigma factor [Dehalococcoidia bacterium]|nr:sigma-70 family RNA polymerase sigma factor [Dehalococcoidia bacterium]